MTAKIRGLTLTASCLGLGILLGFWALGSWRLAVGDRDVVLESACLDPWAQAWAVRADTARFRDMDTDRASDAYLQAVARNPLLFGCWFALAQLENRQGPSRRADALCALLLENVPPATPWRWRQLLLAAECADEGRFRETFNFVLQYLPQHRQEAVEMALGFWGDWSATFARTDPANTWTLLQECMSRGAVDEAVTLYSALQRDPGTRPDARNRDAFIEFLLSRKRWTEAVRTGGDSGMSGGGPVTNPGFEEPLSGRAFGWRAGKVRGVEVRREKEGDGHAMRFHLLGVENLRFDHFWQYVPVEEGTSFTLRFSWKARRLTTDRGMYMEVRAVGLEGMRVRSREMTGSGGWMKETLVFTVPRGCHVVRVGLRRDESLMFDNKIAGDLWIDDVEMVAASSGP